eukprot:766337-Hanusia_phi.AAC.2
MKPKTSGPHCVGAARSCPAGLRLFSAAQESERTGGSVVETRLLRCFYRHRVNHGLNVGNLIADSRVEREILKDMTRYLLIEDLFVLLVARRTGIGEDLLLTLSPTTSQRHPSWKTSKTPPLSSAAASSQIFSPPFLSHRLPVSSSKSACSSRHAVTFLRADAASGRHQSQHGIQRGTHRQDAACPTSRPHTRSRPPSSGRRHQQERRALTSLTTRRPAVIRDPPRRQQEKCRGQSLHLVADFAESFLISEDELADVSQGFAARILVKQASRACKRSSSEIDMGCTEKRLPPEILSPEQKFVVDRSDATAQQDPPLGSRAVRDDACHNVLFGFGIDLDEHAETVQLEMSLLSDSDPSVTEAPRGS